MENVSHMDIKAERSTLEFVAGGSLIEGIAGTGAIVLAIMGLAGVMPLLLGGIAAIAIGLALMFEGGAIGARFSSLVSETSADRLGAMELGGGMTAEFLGGITGIILGILSLLGFAPMLLISITAIVFGGALLLGTAVTSRLNKIMIARVCDEKEARHVAREMVKSAASIQLLFGVGSLILGVISILGIFPMILSLAALLAVGFSNLVSGTAITGRMLSAFHCA